VRSISAQSHLPVEEFREPREVEAGTRVN
jgi:hypothetical protein